MAITKAKICGPRKSGTRAGNKGKEKKAKAKVEAAKVVAAKEKGANSTAKGKVASKVKPSCYHAREPRGVR